MEPCYNGTLRHVLTMTHGSMLSECVCRRCFRLEVVTYLLHSQGIVPKDIDFLIDQHNCVSLVDFSSPRHFASGDELSMARHTTDGYWLLEVIARLSYNPRTADVWVVSGVTLNILLTSRFPFSGDDRQVLVGIQKGIDLRKGMSVHLSEVVSEQHKGRLHYVIHVSAHFSFGELDWCDSVDLDTDSSGGDGTRSTSLQMISCASSEAIEGETMAIEHQQDTSMEPPFGLGVQHQHPVVHRFMVDISVTSLLLPHCASSSYTVRDTTPSTSGMGVAEAVSVAVGVGEAVSVATRRKSLVFKFDCELGDTWIESGERRSRSTVAGKTDTDKQFPLNSPSSYGGDTVADRMPNGIVSDSNQIRIDREKERDEEPMHSEMRHPRELRRNGVFTSVETGLRLMLCMSCKTVWMRILCAVCLLHVVTAENDLEPDYFPLFRYYTYDWRELICPVIGAVSWVLLVPPFLRLVGFARYGLRPGSVGAKLHHKFNNSYRHYVFMFNQVNLYHSIGMGGLNSFDRVKDVALLGLVFGRLMKWPAVYVWNSLSKYIGLN